LVAAAKFLVAATKKLIVVPNFVAVTIPFFSVSSFQRSVLFDEGTGSANFTISSLE